MTKNECEICEGTGYIDVPDRVDTRMRCKCTLKKLYRNKLGNEIFGAKALEASPFADVVDQNLFVVSTRRDFLPHLRYSLIEQGLSFFSRITNDSQMLDAWLAKPKEHSKQEGTDSTGTGFTSLRDLVEDPELMVLFLGIVSYGNKALPGVLLEALRIRSFKGLPTWIINPHSQPFNQGHYCYSPEVDSYISDNFHQEKIKPSVKTRSLYEGVEIMEDSNASSGSPGKKKVDMKKLSQNFYK